MTVNFFSRIINQLKMKRTLLQRRLSTRQYTRMRSRARSLSSGHWERVTCQHGGSLHHHLKRGTFLYISVFSVEKRLTILYRFRKLQKLTV